MLTQHAAGPQVSKVTSTLFVFYISSFCLVAMLAASAQQQIYFFKSGGEIDFVHTAVRRQRAD